MVLKLLVGRMRLGVLAILGLVATLVAASPAAAEPAAPAEPGGDLSGYVDRALEILATLGTGSLEDGLPEVGGGETTQMIVVTAPERTSPKATLTAFEKGEDGTWTPVIGPTPADLGELGMGEPADHVWRTPEGTFALDQAFGRQENPGTAMPYIKVDQMDWWDANPESPTYNRHVRQAHSPGSDSENLYNMGPVYDYGVNINHNPANIPGKASAIFLHVSNGMPTWGCVAVGREQMIEILRWLDPAKNPKITIGVNQDAPPADAIGQADGESAPSQLLESLPLDQLAGLIPTLLGTLGSGA